VAWQKNIFLLFTLASTIMVVRIRLAMHGRRNNRTFRLVAINSQKARNAQPIETLGIYDPAMTLGQKHKTVEWSVDRIKYWLGVGALPSKTVVRLLEVVSSLKCLTEWWAF
jgi:small subunit ribosomal protein S16